MRRVGVFVPLERRPLQTVKGRSSGCDTSDVLETGVPHVREAETSDAMEIGASSREM